MARWHSTQDEILSKLLRNSGILYIGQTSAAILNLVTGALVARALGPEGFGILATIFAYVTAWDRIANFQSFEVLIKYGVDYLERREIGRFKALIKLTLGLDFISAIGGAIIAALTASIAAGLIGWDKQTTALAQIYCLVILFNLSGTPMGLLRLFDDYLPLSLYQNFAGLLRLIGIVAVWIFDGTLSQYLIVWLVAEIISKAYLVATAWLALRRRGYHSVWVSHCSTLLSTTPQIAKFAISSHLLSSLRFGTRELDTLIVAGMLGASSAGLYRIAKQFGSVLESTVAPIYATVFPELSRLIATEKYQQFLRLILQTAFIAAMIGLFGWLVFLFLGKEILVLVAGEEFVPAFGVLVAYTFATFLATSGTPLQPAILALGRPHISFLILLISTLIYIMSLFALTNTLDLVGAGVAYIVFYVAWTAMAISVILRWRARKVIESGS